MLEEAEEKKSASENSSVPEKPPRNNELSFHTEEMSQEIAELMLNNVGLFAKRASIAEEKQETDVDQAALLQGMVDKVHIVAEISYLEWLLYTQCTEYHQ